MSSAALPFSTVFNELYGQKPFDPETLRRSFQAIFAGAWTPAQIAGFLVALRFRGESPELLVAAAQAMREVMVRVEHPFEMLLDTCGTGGDGSGSLNLSTGAAVIAAAAGVPVAKHGNRAASSKSGTADVLEALGLPLDLSPAAQAEVLAQAKIIFLFAQAHHPAMRHAMPVRRELGIRTLFNCIGPLANPAGATHQLVGAPDDALRPMLARALAALGSKRAWVVRSSDGLDEVSPYAPTRVTELEGGELREFSISPEDFGISPSPAGAIDGADPASNARVLERVLSGEPHPSTDAFVLNAAAALIVAERLTPKAAADKAREALRSGRARETLTRWRTAALAARGPS
jgi:anthranilate phosphoribosyltransferase